jgi:uncharacterized membrane protein YeaQ/YmgE (transglycosylase-associated protein family)
MTLALTILLGLAIGTLVELLLPGHTLAELILAMLLGVAGALLGRSFGVQTGLYGTEETAAVIASAIGAVTVLLLYGWIFWKGRPPSMR